MPKIGLRSKSGTLCVSLDQAMIAEGFVKGMKANWTKQDGNWVLQLANGIPISNDAQQASG